MTLRTALGACRDLATRRRGTLGLVCGLAIAVTAGPAFASAGASARPVGSLTAATVLTMRSFPASGYPTNTSMRWAFISAAPLLHFVDRKTAAEVTGTIDFASSDGKTVTFSFGVCFQRSGGSAVEDVGGVHPKFQAAAFNWWAQTVTGVISGLAGGYYRVGLCSEAESGNTRHAEGQGTVILAETT